MPSFLKLEGIEKRFGTFTALKGVDLEIDQGEFVCFLGPSGCGKTTLLRIIAGLEAQSAGRIEQAGRDISRLPPSARDYGIVFQSYALFPNLTVADNVGYGLVNRELPKTQVRQRVEELVRLVGLPGSEGKVPSQLSGGQQQRVALARALATSPGLLLLDEPLSALDAIVRVHLRQEIRSLQRTLGVTTIMVTHDQEEALSVADRIVVMNHGVIEQVGTPEQVYREPASPFVADFVGRVNVLSGQVDAAGHLRVGDAVLEIGSAHAQVRAQAQDLKVYLRPEDVLAQPLSPDGAAAQAFGPGASNVLAVRIDKIEFLGAYCLAQVTSARLGEQRLTTVLSMNFLADHGLAAGSALAVRLLPERIRCFGQ